MHSLPVESSELKMYVLHALRKVRQLLLSTLLVLAPKPFQMPFDIVTDESRAKLPTHATLVILGV